MQVGLSVCTILTTSLNNPFILSSRLADFGRIDSCRGFVDVCLTRKMQAFARTGTALAGLQKHSEAKEIQGFNFSFEICPNRLPMVRGTVSGFTLFNGNY